MKGTTSQLRYDENVKMQQQYNVDDDGADETPDFDRLDAIYAKIESTGSFENSKYTLAVSKTEPSVVSVRENSSGLMVAYSSMQADFVPSIEEFVHDYMVQL